MTSKIERYWEQRSENYNNLEWTINKKYINNLIDCSELSKDHLVLDVGSGTGVVAVNIKNKVSSVFALDISNQMLNKGNWNEISFIKWDIRKPLFDKMVFDRIIARMVFHHILKDIEHAFYRCYNCLKVGGKMIIAEAVPPSSSDLVIRWFSDMFSYKEDRVTFIPGQLEEYLDKVGFLKIKSFFFSMPNFSINNWIVNSGLSQDKINIILKMHIDAPKEVKEAYDMRIDGNNILINSKYTIVVGEK